MEMANRLFIQMSSEESNQIFGYIWAALYDQRNHFKGWAIDRKKRQMNLLFEGSKMWVQINVEDEGI